MCVIMCFSIFLAQKEGGESQDDFIQSHTHTDAGTFSVTPLPRTLRARGLANAVGHQQVQDRSLSGHRQGRLLLDVTPTARKMNKLSSTGDSYVRLMKTG